METRILKTSKTAVDPAVIAQAALVIQQGGLVGMPTETVYGLAADATNPQAVVKIFEAKGRPQDNPLIVHISKAEDVDLYAQEIPPHGRTLMAAYWPGPLTIILKKKASIPSVVSCNLETVGIRMPSHPVALAFIRACGTGIAAPSANLSGKPSTTTAAHVYDDLKGKIDMIIDGGDCEIGVESTVVDLSQEIPTLLRPGGITLEQLKKVLPNIVVDPCIYKTVSQDVAVKSPGMKYKHYAPAAPVTILLGSDDAIADYIKKELKNPQFVDAKIGVLCYSECVNEFSCYENVVALNFGSKTSKEDIAHHLFAKLREFDTLSVAKIFANCPDSHGLGLAVVNRLSKAAGFHIINL